MSLLDDLLRLFGTSRVKLRWRWQRFKEGAARGGKRGAASAGDVARAQKFEHQLCPSCGHPASRDDKQCSQCGARLHGVAAQRAGKLLGSLLPEGVPVVTMVFLAACVALYLVTLQATHAFLGEEASGTSPDTRILLRYGAAHAYFGVEQGQYWRFVTANFLHGGLLHIGMNAYGLWITGRLIEERFGRTRLVVALFVTGVAGHAFSSWWRLNHESAPWPVSVGASTAVFGLIGFVIGHTLRFRGRATRQLRDSFVQWLLYGIIFSLAVPRVDLMGHLGGLGAGLVMGLVVADKQVARRAPEPLWQLLAALCIAITVGAFYAAAQYQVPKELLS